MSEPTVEFGELPARPGGRQRMDYRPVAEALRARPGEWARIRQSVPDRGKASNYVASIKGGLIRVFRPVGAFEAAYRKSTDGFDVWARYVGGES